MQTRSSFYISLFNDYFSGKTSRWDPHAYHMTQSRVFMLPFLSLCCSNIFFLYIPLTRDCPFEDVIWYLLVYEHFGLCVCVWVRARSEAIKSLYHRAVYVVCDKLLINALVYFAMRTAQTAAMSIFWQGSNRECILRSEAHVSYARDQVDKHWWRQ